MHIFASLYELHRLRNSYGTAAPHGDCLQILGAHDGPKPATTGCASLPGYNASKGHQILTGRADASDTEAIPYFVLEDVLGFHGVFATKVGGISDLDTVIIYTEIYRLSGLSLYDEIVIPGFSELGRNMPADSGILQMPVGGDGSYLHPGMRWGHRACQNTGAKTNPVFGIKWRYVRTDLIV